MARVRFTLAKYGSFRFDAGSLCLNFAATVRHRGSRPRDLLPGPDALALWLRDAGLVADPPLPTEEEHRAALALRQSIHASVRAIALRDNVETADVSRMNAAAALPLAAPQLAGSPPFLSWKADNLILSALAAIARDAVTLVGAADRRRVKICRHRDCRMLFLDASPRNSRRWCAMSICGNREKVAAHRRRLKNRTNGGSQ